MHFCYLLDGWVDWFFRKENNNEAKLFDNDQATSLSVSTWMSFVKYFQYIE